MAREAGHRDPVVRTIVVLFSGGLDSTTLLYALREEGAGAIPLFCYYGQPHADRELAAARDLEPDVELIRLPRLRRVDPEIPDGHYTEPSMKATIFPNRNMVLLAVAASIAIDRGAAAIAYAAHGGDHTIYPDCRPEFVTAIQSAIKLGNWTGVLTLAPFLYETKSDIVRRGAGLGVPFGRTWSCYRDGLLHCGTCGTCVERKEAFALAKVPDPTGYAA